MPDKDLSRVVDALRHAPRVLARDHHVLRGELVGKRERLFEVLHDYGAPPLGYGRLSEVPAPLGQVLQEGGKLLLDGVHEFATPSDEDRSGIWAVLSLVEEVRGQDPGVGRAIREDQALRRPEDHLCDHTVALHQHLGGGDGRAARADHQAYLGDGLGPESERRHPSYPIGAVDVAAEPELVSHHQDRWIDLLACAADRRHHHRHLRDGGHDGGRPYLHEDGWERSLPAWHVEAGVGYRRVPFPHHESGAYLLRPIPVLHRPLAVGSNRGDGLPYSLKKRSAGLSPGRFELFFRYPLVLRTLQPDTVEPVESVQDRDVAPFPHVLDDAVHLFLQLVIEHLGPSPLEESRPLLVV